MQPIESNLRTQIVHAHNAIDQLGELTAAAGFSKALVVTDPGIVAAGHVARALTALKKSNIDALVFDGARENPTTEHVDAGLAVAKDYQPELLIGLGGGSSMDCAKGINFLYSCGGKMEDYWGVGKATGPMLPMFAIPTTAGTGSEMQSFALISQAETHVKMACGDKRASCQIAILDPLLTVTQPPSVTALTGIDAVSHAVETAVTTKRNEVSSSYSQQSWQLLSENLAAVILDPSDLAARAAMQLGAAYAGVAIENSMLGAAHALANPLTATLGTAHGQAVGLMLPHVVRFNGRRDNQCEKTYAEMGGSSQSLAETITGFCEHSGLRTRLSEIGVDEEQLPELAAAASKQWTGTFNPVPVNESSLLEIYRDAL
jgi:alcohol dehydrogenase